MMARMELYWQQLPFSWLAFHPAFAENLAAPPTKPVDEWTRELCALLLEIAGTRVAVQFDDAWESELIARNGELAETLDLIFREGQANHCHTNCASAWQADPTRYRIQTGFTLSGGVWRRHTWLLDQRDRIIETTFPQEMYFGAILDEDESLSFTDA
jgi:hypothetical protein